MKMKDSGIEWIGEIPDEWEISKLKYLGQFINGYAFKPEDWGSTGNPIIRIQDLTESNANPNYYDGKIDEKYIVNNGDILVSWAATLNAFIWKNGTGLLNQHIFKAIPDENKIDKDFFFWIIKESMKNMNNDNKHGIVMQHVTLDVFNNFSIPIPPKPQQIFLTKYLNSVCSLIDCSILKERLIIEKLKEYRQALITEAVTKGLNRDVKMKDSWVEWIGEIPEHWEVSKIKYITSKIGSGKTPKGGSDVYSDKGIIFIRSQNVYDNELKLDDVVYISNEIDKDMENTRVISNDVLLNITGGSIGRCCIYPENLPPANVNQHVCIIRTIDTICFAKFIRYFWNSTCGYTSIDIFQSGANREGLNFEQIGNTSIPLPPLPEQQSIADFLDRKCGAIDCVIRQKEEFIAKLEEYKKSLIYECVTGKKILS